MCYTKTYSYILSLSSRFGRAATTIGRIAFDYRRSLYASAAESLPSSEYERVKSACHQRSANRLLALCSSNGGVFMKVGQHIGALDYLLPEEYVQTMKVLHSGAPKVDVREVYKVIREELGREVGIKVRRSMSPSHPCGSR